METSEAMEGLRLKVVLRDALGEITRFSIPASNKPGEDRLHYFPVSGMSQTDRVWDMGNYFYFDSICGTILGHGSVDRRNNEKRLDFRIVDFGPLNCYRAETDHVRNQKSKQN